jgi:hypothetical protein
MVLLNPRGIHAAELRARGFDQTLAFSILPSLADPRVIAPLENSRVAARALDFFTLYRPLAKTTWRLALLLARSGQLGRLGDRVVLARRSDSELERWLRSVTALPQVSLAISPGGISHKRKVTVQVVAPEGRVMAFVKLARSPAAQVATERESIRLRELAQRGVLDGTIPRVLAQATIGGTFMTVLTPGPGALAPRGFCRQHWEFLTTLATATRANLPFERSVMWANLCAGLEALQPRLSTAWGARLNATLSRVRAILAHVDLPLSLAHRDFQPGNTRQFPDGRLFVFDWEGAQPESTPLYDFFNFDFLHSSRLRNTPNISAYLGESSRKWGPGIDPRLLPALFAAYLADHTVRRLTNSVLSRDALSVQVLNSVAKLLDRQGEWLGSLD